VTSRLRLVERGRAPREPDLPERRPVNAGLHIDLSRGRGAAPPGQDVKPVLMADRIAAAADRPVERQPGPSRGVGTLTGRSKSVGRAVGLRE
jgi:hypothetical protein